MEMKKIKKKKKRIASKADKEGEKEKEVYEGVESWGNQEVE